MRPLSTIDSGLYSTDSTDSDQEQDKSKEQGKHKDRIFILKLLASPIVPRDSVFEDKDMQLQNSLKLTKL